MLFLRAEDAFTGEVKETVRSGVLAQFTFFVRFYRVRELWFDEKMADMTIIHTIKYDNLKPGAFNYSGSFKMNEKCPENWTCV